MPKLTLRAWLVSAVLALVVLNVAWRIYAGWGLVTLSVDKRPLREVLPIIERQAHVALKSNLDGNTPVTLRLDHAPLTDALEHLAAVTDARWRLVYAMAKNEGTIRGAVQSWQGGGAPEGWKWFDAPMPFGGPGGDPFGEADSIPPDPRREPWKLASNTVTAAAAAAPKPASEAAPVAPGNALSVQLERASLALEAGFLTPADWNPAVAKPPAPGTPLTKAAPRLASAAGGQAQELFLLMKRERPPWARGGNGGGPPPDDNAGAPPPPNTADAGPRQNRGGGGNREGQMRAMGERMQARIDALPPAQRADAQARMNAERTFWESLRDLPPDERRAKMEAHMNDPALQARMEDRNAARDALRTPEQREDRYRSYVQHKAQNASR